MNLFTIVSVFSAISPFLHYCYAISKYGKTKEVKRFLCTWTSLFILCLSVLLKTNMGYFICFYVTPDMFLLLFNILMIGVYDHRRSSSLIYGVWGSLTRYIKACMDSVDGKDEKKMDFPRMYNLEER
ncbi:hypothetical protein TNCT_609691 [Trichonephila clavata]|uniref:Uncharacterized protein n=1 Tax=Trichonephila clavata TaxID=2740835 RepID=A0A8X6GT44_TRICU|nr:hypothetical protein TNCT_609691 [Trichonephila clavata]